MFIGHFGVALAAKSVAPKPSLGTLVLAAQLLDVLWPLFLLLGWETVAIVPGTTTVNPLSFTSYPYSHSLLAAIAWGALFSGAYYALRRDRRGALWLWALVLSHWLLDFLVHEPDLPLWPGSRRFGLGAWNSLPLTLLLELGLLAGGVALYCRATRARDRWGKWLLGIYVAILLGGYLAAVFGPPPPSLRVLALSALSIGLFVAWGYWIDRHRAPARAGGGHAP